MVLPPHVMAWKGLRPPGVANSQTGLKMGGDMRPEPSQHRLKGWVTRRVSEPEVLTRKFCIGEMAITSDANEVHQPGTAIAHSASPRYCAE